METTYLNWLDVLLPVICKLDLYLQDYTLAKQEVVSRGLGCCWLCRALSCPGTNPSQSQPCARCLAPHSELDIPVH